MADEIISIVVTDDGSIATIAEALQLLGLTGEAATQRLASGYENVSSAQSVVEASVKTLTAVVNAGFTATTNFGAALDKLTPSEQKAATSADGLARLQLLLNVAYTNGIDVAIELASAMDAEALAANRAEASAIAQSTAVNSLTRSQQTLTEQTAATATATRAQVTAAEGTTAALGAQSAATTEATTATQRFSSGGAELVAAFRAEAAAVEKNTSLFAEFVLALGGAAKAIAAGVIEATAYTGVLERLAVGLRAAGTASISAAEEISAVGAAASKVGESIGGLNALFAGFLTTSALISASDTYTKISAGVRLVSADTETYQKSLTALENTSNATQTSLEGNEKLFVSLSEATKGTGISTDTLIKSVQGFDTVLKVANLTGQDAYRVQRTLSEILSSTGGNTTRFLTTLRTESPVAYNALRDGAKAAGVDIELFGAQQDAAALKVQGLQQRIIEQKEKLDGNSASVSTFSGELKSAQAQVTSATAEIQKLSTAHTTSAAQAAANQAQIAKLEASINTSKQNISQYTVQLGRATIETKANQQAVLSRTQAELAAAQATQNGTAKTSALIAASIEAGKQNAALAESLSTVKGAFTVLSNNLITFAGNDKDANLAITATKDVILLLANNLDKVIPLVLALGIAVAGLKFAQLIIDIANLGKALLILSVNPVFLAIAAGTAAAIGLAAAFQYFYNIGREGADKLDIVGNILNTVKQAATAAGVQFDKLTAQITANSKAALGSSDSNKQTSSTLVTLTGTTNAQHDAYVRLQQALTSGKISIDQYKTGVQQVNASTTGTTSVLDNAKTAVTEYKAGIQQTDQALVSQTTSTQNATSATKLLTQQFDETGTAINSTATAATNAGNSVKVLTQQFNSVGEAVTTSNTAINAQTKVLTGIGVDYDNVTGSIKTNVTASDQSTTSYKALAAQTDATGTALKTIASAANDATSAESKGASANETYAGSWDRVTSAVKAAITALQNFIAAAAQAAAAAQSASSLGGGGGGGGGASAGARDGGSFSVAGSGPVDSKLIAVSPGEVVTVQTPMQYRHGVAPTYRGGQTHFASGGVTTGAGVDLGQNISVTGSTLSPVGSSVSGFSAGSSAAVGTLTSAVTSNASTTSANTTATTANTQIVGQAVQVTASAAAAAAQAAATNSASDAQLSQLLTDAANAIVNAANNNTAALNNAASAFVAAASTISSGASTSSSSSSSAGTSGGSANGSLSGLQSGTSSNPSFGTGTGTGGYGGVGGTTQFQLTHPDGTSSTYSTYEDYTNAQATDRATLLAAYDKYNEDRLAKANSGRNGYVEKTGFEHFRDGGDVYIPGGTGVDSRIMNLAVSPGETVGVRTPAQQAQQNAPSSGNIQQITLNIQTPDANSFASSKNQIASQLLSGLQRAARRA